MEFRLPLRHDRPHGGEERIMGRLPTGVKPEYTSQIVIMSKPELAGELRAWAEASERFASDLQREVLERGWALIKPELEAALPRARHPRRAAIAAWVERVDRRNRRTPAQRRAATTARRVAVAKASGAEAGESDSSGA
jgi:hypothetical protein